MFCKFCLLIGVYKLVALSLVSSKISAQLKNAANPSDANPLGRMLKVYHDNKSADTENLELKLDEAILRELPSQGQQQQRQRRTSPQSAALAPSPAELSLQLCSRQRPQTSRPET